MMSSFVCFFFHPNRELRFPGEFVQLNTILNRVVNPNSCGFAFSHAPKDPCSCRSAAVRRKPNDSLLFFYQGFHKMVRGNQGIQNEYQNSYRNVFWQ